MGFPGSATAGAGKCPEWAARVVSIEGRVEALPAGASQWQPVALNDTFCPEDQIRTLANSRAAVQLSNETMLRLDQNTLVKFSATTPESPSLLELFTGRALFMTRFPHPLTIDTPYVNASSGGTEYVIEVDPEHKTSTLTVIEGTMHLKNAQGTLTVTDGQSSVTHAGGGPVLRVVVNVKDVLHWALYYPPVLNLHDLDLGETKALPASDWRAMVANSITAYQNGDLAQSFAALEKAPANIDDPRFYDYRASLRLAVGRLAQAQADIKQALTLSPQNGLALALQSLIAVVQNHPDKALKLAQEAAGAEPESSSVRIALTYAWQANFNLPQALTAAQDATRLDPKSSLAWARTAELWLSQGYLAEALEAAKKAEALQPGEARIQTIVGFAYLTQIKVKQAQAAFEQAIALNSSDPLSRLGLGLAKIRQGKLAEGRQEIEIAAALDPGNALIRSYLGKAYYEEKRNGKAAIQFKLSEQLDPKDPTPYSYDAVLKQTTNRPVEALHDVQIATQLNDNRAVYRSRLLLDSDLASRSVSRGRIYQDLGFEQRALIEGFQSVNTDPMNYSAQRFLADSYAKLPQSEIARQSALLTSQLLQPINTNPVQPSLSNDSVLAVGQGVPGAAFNEYSQLFDSNGTRLLASGLAGQQHTLGDELVLNGVHNRFSWSLGQFHYNTDGFRDNAGIDQKIYDVYAQGQLTTKMSIQGEARLNQTDNGYLSLYYDPTIYSPTYNKNQTDRTYRLGAHYAPTPASAILVSAFYQHHTENASDQTAVGSVIPGFGLTDTGSQRARIVEAQYLAHLSRATLMTGAGYYTAPTHVTINPYIDITGVGRMPLPPLPDNNKSRQTDLYFYSTVALTHYLTLAIGASANRFHDETIGDHKQFNPKLGLMWNVGPATTLRAVGLRAQNRAVVSNQTIEPTQVAGFQQFFEDLAASDYKLYGMGLDHKFSENIFTGLEFTNRKVKFPVRDFSANTVNDQSNKYRIGRAYLYWTTSKRIGVSADYYYDHTEGDPSATGEKTTTQRLPVGIKYFHLSGFFVGLTASYIVQSGNYYSQANHVLDPVSSHFWLLDSAVGYRLPRRRGILSVGVQNLTDRQFRLNEVDPQNTGSQDLFAPLQPRRFMYAKLTLSFN